MLMMTLSKFVWIENRFSLFAGTLQLFVDRQYFLFTILLTFSILLPVAKLILLFRFWYADSSSYAQLQHFMNWISHYGKWSMLDVFVVALLLVIVKLGALATVQVHYGIYMYAGAGLLIMLTTTIISSIAKKDIEKSLES
jgi:paraquat-inducible protein A